MGVVEFVRAVEFVRSVGAEGAAEIVELLGVLGLLGLLGLLEALGGDGAGVLRKKVVVLFPLEGAAGEPDTLVRVRIDVVVFEERGGLPVPPWLG